MIPRLTLTEQTPRLTRDFLAALATQGFCGELRHDFGTRLVTATDNSIYQITPQAVVPTSVTAIAAAIPARRAFLKSAMAYSPGWGGLIRARQAATVFTIK